jgi:hypothetical protein
LVAGGIVTVTVTIDVTSAGHEPAPPKDTAFTTAPAPAPAEAVCSEFGAVVEATLDVTVVGIVAVAVSVPGVAAVWDAVEALLVQVSLWLEQSSTPNAAPARPEQVLNWCEQAALAAEGRSTNDSSRTIKELPLEVTPGGRPPRERMKSKKVITSSTAVVVVTVVVTAAVVAVVVVLSTARTAEALVVDTSWAVVERLPDPAVETAAAVAVVDAAELVEFVFPFAATGVITPLKMSYRPFLSDGLKTLCQGVVVVVQIIPARPEC